MGSVLGHIMKERIASITVLMTIGALVAYFSAWAYNKSHSRPLYGLFDVGMKCMGGHEIFLELDSNDAFANCPGHKDRSRVGRIIRTATSVMVVDPRDDSPWFRIDWDGTGHSLSFVKRPDSGSTMGMIPIRGPIHLVTNPWRVWIPRLLPGD